MSFTHKREWAEAIRDAKKVETRERGLVQALAVAVAKSKTKSKSRK